MSRMAGRGADASRSDDGIGWTLRKPSPFQRGDAFMRSRRRPRDFAPKDFIDGVGKAQRSTMLRKMGALPAYVQPPCSSSPAGLARPYAKAVTPVARRRSAAPGPR